MSTKACLRWLKRNVMASTDNKRRRTQFSYVPNLESLEERVVPVVASPTLSKLFGAATVALNATTSLTFTINNPNAANTLTGVSFSDFLPAGLIVATPNGLTGSVGGGTITATAGSNGISLSGATLPANASGTFSVNVVGIAAGTDNNATSTVTSNEAAPGNPGTASIIVVAPPTLSKLFGAATVPLNGTTSLTFTVGDPNGSTTLTGIGFSDTLPAGLVIATPNGLTGSVGGGTITATAGSNTITLSGASLPGNANGSFSVNVVGITAGTDVNTTSTVSSTEGGAGAAATASIVVVAPPTLNKVFGAGTIPLGATTSLTFTLADPNASTALAGVGFIDTLPAGLVVATPTSLTSTVGGVTTATPGSNTITLSGGALAANSSGIITVNVTGIMAGVQTNTTSTVASTNGGAGAPATAVVRIVGLPFTDSFTQTDGTDLTAAWNEQVGDFDILGNQAHADAPLNLATSIAPGAADVVVQADIAFPANGDSQTGLVARYSGSGDLADMYWGFLVRIGGTTHADIFRHTTILNNWTPLADALVAGNPLAGRMRFEVIGNSLQLFLNGGLIASAVDANPLVAPGSVGVRSLMNNLIDNFSAKTVFTDTFTQANGTPLNGANWTTQSGSFPITNNVVTSGPTTVNLATLTGLSETDEHVEADAAVASNGAIGLVARSSGSDYYWGAVIDLAGVSYAAVFRHSAAGFALLSAIAAVPGNPKVGKLRFETVGAKLSLYLNDGLVASATDGALASGSVGMLSIAGGLFDNFREIPRG